MGVLSIGDIAIRLAAAVLLGGLVGLERERKHRPAGFRTMILISLGSAAFMLIGLELVAQAVATMRQTIEENPKLASAPLPSADLTRVLQGLLGGIGFLGAGAVIQNKKAVRGLTTAAAVWCTSAIGAASGLAMYKVAIGIAVLALFTLFVLERLEERYFPDPPDDARDRAVLELLRGLSDGERRNLLSRIGPIEASNPFQTAGRPVEEDAVP